MVKKVIILFLLVFSSITLIFAQNTDLEEQLWAAYDRHKIGNATEQDYELLSIVRISRENNNTPSVELIQIINESTYIFNTQTGQREKIMTTEQANLKNKEISSNKNGNIESILFQNKILVILFFIISIMNLILVFYIFKKVKK